MSEIPELKVTGCDHCSVTIDRNGETHHTDKCPIDRAKKALSAIAALEAERDAALQRNVHDEGSIARLEAENAELAQKVSDAETDAEARLYDVASDGVRLAEQIRSEHARKSDGECYCTVCVESLLCEEVAEGIESTAATPAPEDDG